jgi:TRAP-type C4-dicarboxylate transport system substrate-binding protein
MVSVAVPVFGAFAGGVPTFTTLAPELASSGVHFVKDVDKKAFQAAVKPVWDKYGSKYADLVKRINAVQ